MFSQTVSLSMSHLFRMLIALGELTQGSQDVTLICCRKPDSSPNGSSGSHAISQVEQERWRLQAVLFVTGNQGKSNQKKNKELISSKAAVFSFPQDVTVFVLSLGESLSAEVLFLLTLSAKFYPLGYLIGCSQQTGKCSHTQSFLISHFSKSVKMYLLVLEIQDSFYKKYSKNFHF